MAEAESRCGSGAAGVFPLGFGWQSIEKIFRQFAGVLLTERQLVTVVGAIKPTDLFDGAPEVSGEEAGVGSNDVDIFLLSDFVLPDPVAFREADESLGALPAESVRIRGGTPHGKRAGLDPDHVGWGWKFAHLVELLG